MLAKPALYLRCLAIALYLSVLGVLEIVARELLKPIHRFHLRWHCCFEGALAPEELKKLEDALTKRAGEVIETVQKALKDEVDKFNNITTKTNEKLIEVSTSAAAAQKSVADFKLDLTELQQKLAKRPGGGGGDDAPKSAGQMVIESEQYKGLKPGAKDMPDVVIGGAHLKTNLINATGQNQPLVPDMRVPGIITTANRRLTIRDLLPNLRTQSNLVQYVKENVYTNNAGYQFSSPDSFEGVSKNESGITFTLANSAVATIAHFIPASRQILDDAPGLQSYIDSRLMYGLKLKEETEILLADGTSGSVNGLYPGATAYNRGVSNDTMLDCLLKAMLQVALSEYVTSGMVLNPADWTQIQLLKDTNGRYLFADPQSMAQSRLWGVPVVSTNSMTAGTFLLGAFDLAAAIWDREDANIRVSEHHASFFIQNMVAILCEERLAVTVYRATSIIKGSLPALGT